MSIEAIKWAVEQAPPMPAQLVATLVGLANHADTKGRGAYPSLPTLAAYTCKSDRSVRRDLRDLETLGLIRPGDPARTAHLPSDKRPEVYDLALELTVPDGRAGKNEGTRASARTLASSRARGGKKKPSSDDMRADVDVRGDADVRADVDVTSGRTSTSQRADVGVRQTVLEPSVEPLSPRVPQQTAPDPPAAPSAERETKPAANDTDKVIAAYEEATGRPLIGAIRTQMAKDAADHLANGFPVHWLIDRARELGKESWTDLAKHCQRSRIPIHHTPVDGKPPYCGQGHDTHFRMIRDNDGDLIECPRCHPAAVARARRQAGAA